MFVLIFCIISFEILSVHIVALTVHSNSAFTELTGQFWIGCDTFRAIAFYHLCKKKKLAGSVVGELHYIVTGIAACVLRILTRNGNALSMILC